MTIPFRTIFFLKDFSIGILMPVSSLLLLSRGASLNTLAFIWGAHSLIIVIMEFPSGILCDLLGRKKIFLLSCGLMLLALFLLLVFPGLPEGVIALLFLGLSRACSSGSLDALVIEQNIQTGGETALARINGELAILENLGIAFGSLAGGILSGLGNQYHANIFSMLVLYILITALVVFHVRESFPLNTPKSNPWKQALKSISYTIHVPKLLLLMSLIFASGIIQSVIETYWQPAFICLPDFRWNWLLGFLPFCAFLFNAAGSHFTAKLLIQAQDNPQKHWWRVFFLTKLLNTLCLILLAVQLHTLPFLLAYSTLYLFQGSYGVAANSLLSQLIPDNLRASIMSLFSLFFQAGGLAAAGISGIVVTALGIPNLWLLAGGCSILSLACSFVIYSRLTSS